MVKYFIKNVHEYFMYVKALVEWYTGLMILFGTQYPQWSGVTKFNKNHLKI